jgi:hypothetical protein
MDDDDTGLGQKQSADSVMGDVPLRGEFSDGEVSLKVRRIVVRASHRPRSVFELLSKNVCELNT